MSSDPLVSDAAIAEAKTSTKRSLNNGGETNTLEEPHEASIDTSENPPKRVKVEGEEESRTDENPLGPLSKTAPSERQQQGDNGAKTLTKTDDDTTEKGAAIQNGIDPKRSQGDTSATMASPDELLSSPPVTSSQSNPNATTGEDCVDAKPAANDSTERWRVHRMAEDYTSFVGSIMYPATRFQNYGYDPQQRQYPIEKISLLGFMKSPFRRPSVIEKWSPYEIAMFEGSMFHYGKEFRKVSREIGTKSTREVIEFYYIWKKTGHYQKWKEQFVSDEDLMEDFPIPVKKPKR